MAILSRNNFSHLTNSAGALFPPAVADTISHLVTELKQRSCQAILLDWDGCVMKISEAHAQIALHALKRCPLWNEQGVSIGMREASAAYRGDLRVLGALHLSLGGEGEPKIAAHGAPWDILMGTNLVDLPLQAKGLHACKIEEIKRQFIENIDHASTDLASQGNLQLDANDLVPGAEKFLSCAFRNGLPVHVVTMTPTSVVCAFAERLGVAPYIESFQGCDQFSSPNGKREPGFWLAAAARKMLQLNRCAVVEDNRQNLDSAIADGALLGVSLSTLANGAMNPRIADGAFLMGPADWDFIALEVSPAGSALDTTTSFNGAFK